jgi:hypothetical protein
MVLNLIEIWIVNGMIIKQMELRIIKLRNGIRKSRLPMQINPIKKKRRWMRLIIIKRKNKPKLISSKSEEKRQVVQPWPKVLNSPKPMKKVKKHQQIKERTTNTKL